MKEVVKKIFYYKTYYLQKFLTILTIICNNVQIYKDVTRIYLLKNYFFLTICINNSIKAIRCDFSIFNLSRILFRILVQGIKMSNIQITGYSLRSLLYYLLFHHSGFLLSLLSRSLLTVFILISHIFCIFRFIFKINPSS